MLMVLRGQIFFRGLFRENQSVSRLRSIVTVLGRIINGYGWALLLCSRPVPGSEEKRAEVC